MSQLVRSYRTGHFFISEITEGKSQVMGKYHGSSPQRRLTKHVHKEYNRTLTFQFKEVYIFKAKPQVIYTDRFFTKKSDLGTRGFYLEHLCSTFSGKKI